MASLTTRDELDKNSGLEQENLEAQESARSRRRFGPFFWFPLAWLGFIVFCAIFADLLPLRPNDEMDFTEISIPPWESETYWLGTDLQGRDILSRIIYGARVSLTVGAVATSIGMFFGLCIGLLAGYYRGWTETGITMGLDTVLALPALVVLLLASVTFGGSLKVVGISLGLLLIPAFARVSRANTLNFAQREFVVAAKAMGARDLRIILLEILPNVVLPVAAYGLVVVAFAIVVEGALSFLGLSVPSPVPSWGGMIAEGRESLGETPHIAFIAAIVMFLTVLSFNLVGDALRSRLADLRESAV
ncbi:MAG: ABC transporter permease [Alphaproteobacteria bacterium]|jgi:peptide/nickel transport system permease protein|nr:ABC transporter permease [Alphaproteobacteria bacterium]MDP6813413.1 ABC transporter permease [Alphaproteobacteria bacterium]